MSAIRYELGSDQILTLTIDMPGQSANTMNAAFRDALSETAAKVKGDLDNIRGVIIASAKKTFFAGGDLKERNNMTDEAWQTQHALFEQAVRAMMDCPIPMIGAVNGAAFAGGLEIALCCDFVYCAPNARFALTEVTLGIMPGAGGTQNLPRAVGVRRAKEIIGKLLEDALATAEKIAGNAPISTRQVKKAIDMSTQLDLKSGYAFEIEAYNRMVPTEDRLEGVRAFNEKRKAQFKGK